jgi:hypothetical protein
MIKFKEMLEDVYTSEYKEKQYVGQDGKTHTRKIRPRRIDFKNSKSNAEPAKKDEMQEELNLSEDIKAEYDSLKKNHDIKSLRGLIKTQHKIIDTSEFKTKDHAISHYLRAKHGDKRVAAAFGLKEEQFTESHVELRIDHREKGHGDQGSTLKDHEAKVSDTSDKATYFKVPSHKVESFKSVMKSKHGVKVEMAEENTMTIDEATPYYNKPSFLKKMSRVAKQERQAREKKEAEGKMNTFKNHITHNMPTNEETSIEEQLHEVLSKDAKAADWISDFVKSDNPKFAGKSKKERVKMALGAYYGKQNEEAPQAPQAPTLDRKYIKGTPEHKAHKALRKPINGHPTGKYNEETAVEESVVPDHMKGKQKPYVSSDGKGNYEVLGNTGQSKATFTRKEHGTNAQSKAREHLKSKYNDYMKEEVELDEDAKGHTMEAHGVKGMKNSSWRKTFKSHEHAVAWADKNDAEIHGTRDLEASKKGNLSPAVREEVELDEKFINGREYASHGLMHPDHAKMDIHKVSGQHVDFYASKTGDKMQGKVTKNDGKSVHIQAHKDKELGDGKLHKFKVTPHLPKQNNEQFENGELETTMKSYKEFMESLDEALWPGTPEYNKKFGGGAKREVGAETSTTHGKAIGTGTGVKHERDYEKAEKETPAPADTNVKRGRGRPAGSTSGARQKGTIAKSEYAGADYTGHKLHLPNSNR